MKNEGFEGCVGFVDGTTFPIFQRPGKDGEVFFNRKKRYLLNAQVICDCNKYITAFITGWPGSCADSFVFKKMKLHIQPAGFFDQGRSSGFNAFMGIRPRLHINKQMQNSTSTWQNPGSRMSTASAF
jgi:hypothetical protein